MTKLQKLKLLSTEFSEFLRLGNSKAIAQQYRFYVIDLTRETSSKAEDLADEAVFSSSLADKIENKRIAMLYLTAWLYLGERVNAIFAYASKFNEADAVTIIKNRINYFLGKALKDRKFMRSFEKVIEVSRGINE